MKKDLKKLLLGTDFDQEYICASLEKLDGIFEVSVVFSKESAGYFIPHNHLFLGYRPLMIGLVADEGETLYTKLMNAQEVSLHYTAGQSGNKKGGKLYGNFRLSKTGIHKISGKTVFLFEGKKGKQNVLPYFQWMFNKAIYFLKAKRKDNVYLPGNLYEQITLAYSYPRIISLISVSDRALVNIFPTDLHGPIGDQEYVISLRTGGKACEQVKRTTKIILSEVRSSAFKEVYSMGKNHMKEMVGRDQFSLLEQTSALWKLPLSSFTLQYRELELYSTRENGIHTLLFFKVRNVVCITKEENTLCHFKNIYASWRKKKNLSSEYLLR